MVKLNILDMKNFLNTVNACTGKVNMLCPDSKKRNINGEEKIQDSLWRQYRQNKNCLRIVLEIPNPADYMSIVVNPLPALTVTNPAAVCGGTVDITQSGNGLYHYYTDEALTNPVADATTMSLEPLPLEEQPFNCASTVYSVVEAGVTVIVVFERSAAGTIFPH